MINFDLFKDMAINGQAVVQLSLGGSVVWKKGGGGDEPIPISLNVGDMFPEEFKVKKSDVIDYDNRFILGCYVWVDKDEGYEESANLEFYWESYTEDINWQNNSYAYDYFDITYDDEWVYVSLNGSTPYEISFISTQPDMPMYAI